MTAAAPTTDVREAAAELIDRGFAVCRLRPGEKRPGYAGWSTRSLNPEEFAPGDGIGIVCGFLSDGGVPGRALVCVDLDTPESLARADDFLPSTGMADGRPGKPRSHRYYLVPVDSIPPEHVSRAEQASAAANAAGRHPGPATRSFRTPDRKEAFRLIGNGGHAVCPPSRHESGELREWDSGSPGSPGVVSFSELWSAVVKLADAVGAKPAASLQAKPLRRRKEPPAARTDDDSVASGDVASDDSTRAEVPDDWRDLLGNADSAEPVTAAGRVYSANERGERAKLWVRGIPDNDLSRSGHGGHDRLFYHLRAVRNDFLTSRDVVTECAGIINGRLRALDRARPGEGFDPWGDDELEHKIDSACDAEPDLDYPPGCKLPRVVERLQNFALVKPTPKQPATATGTIRFENMARDGKVSVSLQRDGRTVYADRLNPWSEKSRLRAALELGVTMGQVLRMAEAAKEAGEGTFNVADLPADTGDAEETNLVSVGKHVAEIAADALQLVNGNLRATGGTLFADRDGRIEYLDSTAELFGFIAGAVKAAQHPIHWQEGSGYVTKDEFRSFLTTRVERYDDVYPFPHEPAVPGIYYPSPSPAPGDGATLEKLLGFFAVDSATDRMLLRALWATALWGGPPGSRPIFLIRGPERDPEGGRGVGKSTVAELLGRWCGGCFAFGTGDSVNDLRTRLLSGENGGARIVLWDNVKTDRLSNGDFEGLVTATTISGRQLYKGEGRRPNLFLYVLTMNGGGLSKDFSQRCITIRLRRPAGYRPSWQTEVEQFIDANRVALIADAVAVLKRAANGSPDRETLSRWARWERAVLAGCVANAEEWSAVGAEILARQRADDTDDSEAALLAEKLAEHVRKKEGNPDPAASVIELTTEEIANVTRAVLDCGFGLVKAGTAFNRHLGGIPQVVKKRDSKGAVYFWVGDEHPAAEKLRRPDTTAGALREAARATERRTGQTSGPARPTAGSRHPELAGV